MYLGIFSIVFAIILGVTVDAVEMNPHLDFKYDAEGYLPAPANLPFTAVAFLVGASTSILAGYIGMRIAVYTNTRTAFQCCKGEWIDDNGK